MSSSADKEPQSGGLMWQSKGLEFWSRLAFLEALFRPGHQEGSPAGLLRTLVPPAVSFRWYEGCHQGAYRQMPPPTIRECFDPHEVEGCLGAVLRVLQDCADAFPPLYGFRDERTGERHAGMEAVFEGGVYAIRGWWGRCDAIPSDPDNRLPYPKGEREIDLRNTPRIRCRIIGLGGIAPGRIGSTLGPEQNFRVEKESCLDVYGRTLEAMKSVALRARAEGGLVFTFLS